MARAGVENGTRVVHRHTCYGSSADHNAVDKIGCAERAASLFEHTLTPATLWCNESACLSRFGTAMNVHSIDCDEKRCTVLLHCDEKLSSAGYAALVTIFGIAALIVLLVRANSARHDNTKML